MRLWYADGFLNAFKGAVETPLEPGGGSWKVSFFGFGVAGLNTFFWC